MYENWKSREKGEYRAACFLLLKCHSEPLGDSLSKRLRSIFFCVSATNSCPWSWPISTWPCLTKKEVGWYLIAPNSVSQSVSSVVQSCLTLWLHESQHTRPPCPSQTPRVYSNSCPLSLWCHPTISSSVVPFSSCSQSLPASESFPMSQLFTAGGQSTGISASASNSSNEHPGLIPFRID